MDILDFFWTFYLNHLSPVWGYFFYVQLTNIKLDQPYQTYQQLRTVGYFYHDHPIAGILVSVSKQILPKQPEL